MASDDDEDLAELREMARARQPTARQGARGLDLEALLEKQKREKEKAAEEASFFVRRGGAGQEDDDDEEAAGGDEDEDDETGPGPPPPPQAAEDAEIYDEFRSQFPMNFGKQGSAQTSLEAIHAKTKRPPQSGPGALGTSKAGPKPLLSRPITFLSSGTTLPGPPPGPPPPPSTAADLAAAPPSFGPPRPPPSDRPTGPPPRPPKPATSAAASSAGGADVAVAGPAIGPPRPPPGATSDEDGGGAVVGPPRPQARKIAGKGRKAAGKGEGEDGDEDEDEDGDEEDEDEDDEYRIPLSNEIVLRGHSKVVAALAIDPTGARVLTGSYDYTVRMYDFGGMNAKLAAFRQLEPSDGHQVRALSWSPSGDAFLCCTGSAQAKVYDRDGATLGEWLRGDMYIRDAKNTKGHITGVTAGEWHPRERHEVMTASEDGTIRIWDVTDFKAQKQVIKPKLARPGRIFVTTCTWSADGKMVAGGLQDGSLQVWGVRSGWGSRPDHYQAHAHEQGEEISGVSFTADSQRVVSRSTDGTLKVWDIRKFKDPLKVFEDLPNSYAQTNVAFSPDERLVLTGTSAVAGGAGGQVVVLDLDRLELVRRLGVAGGGQSVVRVAWHPRLNQIFATSGDRKEGGTHILYDPSKSEKGALSCVARAPRQPRVDDFSLARPVIHNPHALPLFRDEPSRKRSREKARKDPKASKMPEAPLSNVGVGGRVGRSTGSLLTQYLLKEGGMLKETWMDEDPREAILKHAEKALAEPEVFGKAYGTTQPNAIYAEPSDDEEEK